MGCVSCQVTRPVSRHTCSAGYRVIPALDSSEVQTLLILSAPMYVYMYVCVCTQSLQDQWFGSRALH